MTKQKPIFDNIEVEDGENYSSPSAYGIKEIALEQFRKCCIEGSKEMLPGGVKEQIINGQVVELTIPNQRELFSNSVDVLLIIMLPDLEKFPEIKHKILEIDSTTKDYEDSAKKDEQKLQNKPGLSLKQWNETIDKINNSLQLVKVDLARQKLIQLSFLLNKKNYYDEMGI